MSLLNCAINHSHVFDQWKCVANLMIKKSSNSTKISKLRVLHLYEAGMNALYAMKYRKIIHHAVDNHLIHPCQFGGIPGRDSIAPVLMPELHNKITRLTSKSIITLDFDAASCYDRICPNLASIISRSFGQNSKICFLHARHLRQAKCFLKTQFGLSKVYFSHSRQSPIFGVGKGSTAAPTIWVVVSSRIFEIHENHAFGARFRSPDHSVDTSVTMVGFVDDCHGSINDFESNYVPVHKLMK